MKKISFITSVLVALFFAVTSFAASVTLTWDRNQEPDIAGYKISYGTSSDQYASSITVNDTATQPVQTSYIIDNLQEGATYYFVIKAFDLAGQEGPFSDEVSVYIQSTFAIGGLSISQIFNNLSSGTYRLTVMADNTYQVEPLGNSPPVVSISANSLEVIEGETVTVMASASDPESDPLTYSWYVDGALDFSGNDSGSWADLSVGNHSVYCIVDDGQGNEVQSNTVSVALLQGPHISVPEILTLNATYGDATADGSIAVTNSGNGDMDWTVSTTSGMLSLSPNSGTNSGNVGITADLTGLDSGDYYGDVVISSPDADNSPQTVPVMVSISDIANNVASIDLKSGSKQYLSITDANQTGLDLATDFTIEAWIKLETLPSTTGIHYTILSKDDPTNSRGYGFILRYNDPGEAVANSPLVYFLDSSGNLTSLGCDTALTQTGIWYHLAVTVDISVPSAKFYIDTVLKSTLYHSTAATTINNSSSPFSIGARINNSTPERFFYGLIDGIRVWNDIRTSTEISDNYNSELVGNEANLVGYWEFNYSLLDKTPNNNDLTISNGSAVFVPLD
ncbi:MAG: hypothetical protein GWO87_01980 [Xanthomonadaceae bacterium]|nr:hypothetical protein [Rhodospirillaceae bacterium]NIA17939.1 hypothetical protein [Xanthomonadaceae bacterium]